MKKWMRVILGTVLVLTSMMTMALSAAAAGTTAVSIPVKISLSGTLPNPAEDYTIKLKADDPSYPMPSGSKDGVYTMTITGAAEKNLPSISYDTVGVYTYTITQVAGKNKDCTYDSRVYALTVQITNSEDGTGLEATAILQLEGMQEKLPIAEFKNKYKIIKKPTNTPKTGDESSPVLYGAMIAVSVAVILGLFVTRKPRHADEESI